MPRKAKELSALAVSRLKDDGRYPVGGADGLQLRIHGGSRAWVLRIMVGGRRNDIGLGPFPEVPLADAREAARDLRKEVRAGGDPVAERRASRATRRQQAGRTQTFRQCAEAYIAAHEAGWKNAKHAKQWGSTLQTYAYPKFGALAVAEIDTPLVLQALQPIWSTKTETASRLRGRIESILDWAKVSGLREGDNPARWRGHLDKLLPARSRVRKVEHHAALPYDQLPGFMRDLGRRDGIAARALEFGVLCASRSNEVRGATWDEIQLEAKLWIIPADRMKAAKEHRVPLSAEAIALLKALPGTAASEFVFPAPSGGALSDMALTAVLRRMKVANVTQHGFRSTFRDWAGETTAFPREVIEHALAHQLKDKAEAAYQRGDLLVKRRALMDAWGAFAAGLEAPTA